MKGIYLITAVIFITNGIIQNDKSDFILASIFIMGAGIINELHKKD